MSERILSRWWRSRRWSRRWTAQGAFGGNAVSSSSSLRCEHAIVWSWIGSHTLLWRIVSTGGSALQSLSSWYNLSHLAFCSPVQVRVLVLPSVYYWTHFITYLRIRSSNSIKFLFPISQKWLPMGRGRSTECGLWNIYLLVNEGTRQMIRICDFYSLDRLN